MGLGKVSHPEVPFYISLLSEIFSNITSSGIPKEKRKNRFLPPMSLIHSRKSENTHATIALINQQASLAFLGIL